MVVRWLQMNNITLVNPEWQFFFIRQAYNKFSIPRRNMRTHWILELEKRGNSGPLDMSLHIAAAPSVITSVQHSSYMAYASSASVAGPVDTGLI